MRRYLLPAVAIAAAAVLGAESFAAVKNAPYPEIKVKLSKSFKPDAGFEKMRAAFADATAKQDAAGVFALIGPTFVWTLGGELVDQFDMGRDAAHNFKVVFGFRGAGKDADGGVADGPFWETLATFATDRIYYQATDSGNLVCGPMTAEIADDAVFELARKKIETGDEGADWYNTFADVAVAKAPGDAGAPLAKLATVAVPVLGVHPPATHGQPAPAATHQQVLLPSGKTGWIPAAAARPMNNNRLCYARTPNDDWKIVAYDESE